MFVAISIFTLVTDLFVAVGKFKHCLFLVFILFLKLWFWDLSDRRLVWQPSSFFLPLILDFFRDCECEGGCYYDFSIGDYVLFSPRKDVSWRVGWDEVKQGGGICIGPHVGSIDDKLNYIFLVHNSIREFLFLRPPLSNFIDLTSWSLATMADLG